VIGLLVAAVVLLVAWVSTEKRATNPLIDMNMMRRPAVWTNNLVSLLVGVGMYGVFAFIPEFVQTPRSAGYGFGATITQSGLILLPSSVTMFFVGIYAGRFARKVGGKLVVIAGCLIGVVAMSMLAWAHNDKWELYVATGIMGAGIGLAFSAMSSLIVAAVPPSQTGVASGMNANIRTIGGAVGAALMASVVTAHLEPSGLPKESGYTLGFAMLAGSFAIAAIAALIIPSTLQSQNFDAEDEPEHAELALLAGGTIVGDKPE
jgi:MFS family permease